MKYPTRRTTGNPLPAISGIEANRLKSEPVRPDVVEMTNSHFATDGKNSTRAKLTELPRNDGGTQCRQFGGVYRSPRRGDEISSPLAISLILRSIQIWTDSRSGEQRGCKFAPPFWGLRKIALTPKLGRGPYKNFEVFCSGLVALLIHFPPSSLANSSSSSSAATWI